jgi:hypothetical protein
MSPNLAEGVSKMITDFDSQHNDLDAKVILISSDKVGFRVHAWYIAQKRYVSYDDYDVADDAISTFVKDSLKLPSSQSLEDAPIQLNQTAIHVKKLLDFIHATGPVPVETAKECDALLEMCDHLQMSNIRHTIWNLVRARMDPHKPDPNAFGLGATRDNYHLCHDAAITFSRYNYKMDDICAQPPSFYQDMPSRYLALLLTNNYIAKGDGSFQQRSIDELSSRFANMTSGR